MIMLIIPLMVDFLSFNNFITVCRTSFTGRICLLSFTPLNNVDLVTSQMIHCVTWFQQINKQANNHNYNHMIIWLLYIWILYNYKIGKNLCLRRYDVWGLMFEVWCSLSKVREFGKVALSYSAPAAWNELHKHLKLELFISSSLSS